MVAILLFFSGLNLTGLGILGEYLARVFVEVKQRPLYSPLRRAELAGGWTVI